MAAAADVTEPPHERADSQSMHWSNWSNWTVPVQTTDTHVSFATTNIKNKYKK